MIEIKFYQAASIAKICGLYSKNNKPHDKFVSTFLLNENVKTKSKPIENNYGKIVNYHTYFELLKSINLLKKYISDNFEEIYGYEEFDKKILLNNKEYLVYFKITNNLENNYLKIEREGIKFENVFGNFNYFNK
jgi:hypothetical protein